MRQPDGFRDLPGALKTYAGELERWNRQINLVSRRGTTRRIGDLIDQCAAAWRGLQAGPLATWAAGGRVEYFDLGSGGGLPGFVWHLHLAAAGWEPRTALVEPREKRAWFLERLERIPGGEGLGVICGRWGEQADLARDDDGGRILISLKALRLQDAEVLGGLEAALGAPTAPRDVLIARFQPKEQRWGPELARSLGSEEDRVRIGGTMYAVKERTMVQAAPEGPVALAVVQYEADAQT